MRSHVALGARAAGIACSLLLVAALLQTGCGSSGETTRNGLSGTSVPSDVVPIPGGGAPPDPGVPPGGGTGLTGGVLVTFDVMGERFTAWVTEPTAVQTLLAVWGGTGTMFSVGGGLRAGSGAEDHNQPWSWHLDPQSVVIDGAHIPECADRPSVVESNLAFFIGTIKCLAAPATLVGLIDKR